MIKNFIKQCIREVLDERKKIDEMDQEKIRCEERHERKHFMIQLKYEIEEIFEEYLKNK